MSSCSKLSLLVYACGPAEVVCLHQAELVKAQRDIGALLELCRAHPRLLGKPLHSSLRMLAGWLPAAECYTCVSSPAVYCSGFWLEHVLHSQKASRHALILLCIKPVAILAI